MNIYDISKKAGCSIATVSRVLNGSDKVSEKTRTKILKIMQETGYTPNVFARGLTNNTIQTIGLLCADCSDLFLANAISYLEKGLRQNGYDCILCCTGNDLATRQNYLNLILSKKVDAIILIGSTFIEEDMDDNSYILDAAKKVPVFNVNGFLDAENVYCTLCNDTEAIYNTTCSFIDNGFTNSLFIYRSDSYSGKRKLDGFKNAYKSKGLKINDKQILLINESIDEIKDRLIEYYEKYKFDSVIAGDDELAVSALKFAKSQNFSVPDDFSIVGYNNSKIGVCCEPEITSLDNQLAFVCDNIVKSLIAKLNGEVIPNKTMISAQLIKRGSTNF